MQIFIISEDDTGRRNVFMHRNLGVFCASKLHKGVKQGVNLLKWAQIRAKWAQENIKKAREIGLFSMVQVEITDSAANGHVRFSLV